MSASFLSSRAGLESFPRTGSVSPCNSYKIGAAVGPTYISGEKLRHKCFAQLPSELGAELGYELEKCVSRIPTFTTRLRFLSTVTM